MSDKAAVPPKKKGGLVKILMIGVGALVLLGGGVAGGVYAASSGMLGGAADTGKGKSHKPAASSHGASSSEGAAGDSAYFAMEQGFTSNLRNSDSFVQTSVAVSSKEDGQKVVDAVKANEPAMRSAILQILAEQEYETVSTTQGRTQLRAKIKNALNQELNDKVGFGGIDNVYFTAFVLQ